VERLLARQYTEVAKVDVEGNATDLW